MNEPSAPAAHEVVVEVLSAPAANGKSEFVLHQVEGGVVVASQSLNASLALYLSELKAQEQSYRVVPFAPAA